MGLTRCIDMDLACQRCGRSYRARIQFKTGHDCDQCYTPGQRVDDLPTDDSWEGITVRHCPSCHAEFRRERELAAAAVLAAFVRDGRLALRPRRGGPLLDGDSLIALGAARAEAASRDCGLSFPPRMLHELSWPDPAGAWTTRVEHVWSPTVHDAHDAEMRRRGWPDGGDPWREDLEIRLDDERRIHVVLLPSPLEP